MKNRVLILSILSSSIFGAVIGAFLTYKFSSEFYLSGYYSSQVARSTIDLIALENIRDSKTKSAIDILETDVKLNTMFLVCNTENTPRSVKGRVKNITNLTHEYAEKYKVVELQEALSWKCI